LELGSDYSLALDKQNDSQSGFHGVVESDCEQITQGRAKEEGHFVATPVEEFLQRNDSKEAYWPALMSANLDSDGGTHIRKLSFRPNVGSGRPRRREGRPATRSSLGIGSEFEDIRQGRKAHTRAEEDGLGTLNGPDALTTVAIETIPGGPG